MMFTSPAWMDSGAKCAEFSPNGNDALFFPPDFGHTVNDEARRYCKGLRSLDDTPCPVRKQCLDYAIAEGIGDGVWGGMSYPERRNYVRRLKRSQVDDWQPDLFEEAS